MNVPIRQLFRTLVLSFLCFFAVTDVASLRAQPPVLGCSYSGGQLTLTWPVGDFWLQTAGALTPDSAWLNVQDSPAADGGTNYETQPVTGSAVRFFRLIYSPFLPPPTRPVLDVGQDADNGEWFELWWDSVPQATSYNIYYAGEPGVTKSNYLSLSEGASLSGITNTFITVSNLVVGHRYYFVATAVSPPGESVDSAEVSGVFSPFATVSGIVYTFLPDGTNLVLTPVPGATITMSNQLQPSLSSQALSSADGSYTFAGQPAGTYALCWSAPGFASGCYSDPVVVSNTDVDIDLTLTNDGTGLIYGRVTLADGGSAVENDPFFGIAANVRVTLSNSNLLCDVGVNAAGEYLISNLATQPDLSLAANNGFVSTTTNVSVSGIQRIDLVLPLTPPQITGLFATSNGVPVNRVPPGTALQVTVMATNETGGLHYAWFDATGAGQLVSADSPTIGWTLPNTGGTHSIYVRVSDNYGGNATAHLVVSTDLGQIFTGFVVDPNGVPISGANVSLNACSTVSDVDGNFSFVLTNEPAPFILRAKSAGYVPYSAQFNSEATAVQCVLVPEPVCTDGFASSSDILLPLGDGQLLIPANSLVAPGGPPLDPVCVSAAVLDPCDVSSQLNFTTTGLQDGTNVELTFLALADVRATDSAEVPLSLTNQPMSLTLAASTNCLNALSNPPISSASVWQYDENAGVWVPAGSATPVVLPSGALGFNAAPLLLGLTAVAIGANPNPRIIDITFDKTLSFPLQFRFVNEAGKKTEIEQTMELIQFSNRAPVIAPRTRRILVPDGTFALQVLSPKEAPGFYPPTPDAANKTVIVQTNLPPPNKLPNGGAIVVGLSSQIPQLRNTRVNGQNMFLTARFGKGSKEVADAYYSVIDPAGAKATLNGFKQANGFNGAGETSAVFFNACDLGFGRSMHLKRTTTVIGPNGDGKDNIAFYVSNYKSVNEASANSGLIATVAMDYVYNPDPAVPQNSKRIISFYVYDETGRRVAAADLDGNGGKFVPNLCMVCHGGRESSLTTFANLVQTNINAGISNSARTLNGQAGDMEARFIPFDPNSYTYGGKDGALSQATQLLKFSVLNLAVKDAAPTSATTDLLKAWTDGGFDAVVDGWVNAPPNNDIEPAYSRAVAISCRACHVVRTGAKAFSTFADFNRRRGAIQNQVYSIPGAEVMPNALRTFTIFWGSKAANSASIKPVNPPPDDQAELIKKVLGLPSSNPTP
jgi:hypothetical protein